MDGGQLVRRVEKSNTGDETESLLLVIEHPFYGRSHDAQSHGWFGLKRHMGLVWMDTVGLGEQSADFCGAGPMRGTAI